MLACPLSRPHVPQMPRRLTLPAGAQTTLCGHHSGRPWSLDLLHASYPTKTYPPCSPPTRSCCSDHQGCTLAITLPFKYGPQTSSNCVLETQTLGPSESPSPGNKAPGKCWCPSSLRSTNVLSVRFVFQQLILMQAALCS